MDEGDEMEEMTAGELQTAAERLIEAASALERTVARMAEQQVALAAEAESQVTRIVATVETQREAELERKLAEAEAKIAELVASAAHAQQPTGRKTLPTTMATMLAKQGVVMDSVEAGAIDGALTSLSIEQRIAVKAELMRAGLLNPSDRG
jgi:regulator of protease activity HflC (stomatin/prohibitin superfamily)